MQTNFKKLTLNINECYNKKKHVFLTWWSEIWQETKQKKGGCVGV
jgi:hypothetical protein